MIHFAVTVSLLFIALLSARFLYEVKFPKPGTRPGFLQVLLVAPVSVVFAISGLFGLMGVAALFG